MSIQRTFYLKEDPELRLVHTSLECPAAKIGDKYNYLKNRSITTVEDAEKMDEDGLKACDWCLKRERRKRASKGRVPHISPPGFRS